MAEAKHYCADCDTHFGGPPNYVTPEEHANVAHDGNWFRGVANGTKDDYIQGTLISRLWDSEEIRDVG